MNRRTEFVGLLAFVIAAMAMAVAYFPLCADDAYIVGRYARPSLPDLG